MISEYGKTNAKVWTWFFRAKDTKNEGIGLLRVSASSRETKSGASTNAQAYANPTVLTFSSMG